MRCETIKIKAENEQGFTVINKDDFDSKTMKKLGAAEDKKVEKEIIKPSLEYLADQEIEDEY